MSNLVFGSPEQRVFAQYAPTSFQINAVNIAQGPGLPTPLAVTVVPTSLKNNFDDSFKVETFGFSVLKAGIYTISYDVRLQSPTAKTDFQAENYISVARDDTFDEEIRYCRTGQRTGGEGLPPGSIYFATNAGSITTFLPVGHFVKIGIQNWYLAEPVNVLGSSKMEVIRLL
jgi:hypothetical protein